MANVIDQIKEKMQSAIEHLKVELKGIRTDRANPAMLDGVSLEIYGTTMRLKDVASVTTPEPRMLLVTPFDPSTVNAIGKGIERANIGFMPIVDANVVRLKIPPMDNSLREKMRKRCGEICEETKVSVRNLRRQANDLVRKQKADGIIPEDQEKRLEKQIQELTDKYCKEADELSQKKEKEVTTI